LEEIKLKLFREQLISMRSCLEAIEKESKDSGDTVELDQSCVGRLSRMDAMQSQQMALETERRRQSQLIKISDALSRIDHDDFGYCFDCDEEIAIRRLKADPTNTKCINCAQ